MKIAIALGLGSLLTLTATTLTARADSEGSPPFRAEIAGGIAARPTGDARFGTRFPPCRAPVASSEPISNSIIRRHFLYRSSPLRPQSRAGGGRDRPAIGTRRGSSRCTSGA